jgi:hypothetical protein
MRGTIQNKCSSFKELVKNLGLAPVRPAFREVLVDTWRTMPAAPLKADVFKRQVRDQ